MCKEQIGEARYYVQSGEPATTDLRRHAAGNGKGRSPSKQSAQRGFTVAAGDTIEKRLGVATAMIDTTCLDSTRKSTGRQQCASGGVSISGKAMDEAARGPDGARVGRPRWDMDVGEETRDRRACVGKEREAPACEEDLQCQRVCGTILNSPIIERAALGCDAPASMHADAGFHRVRVKSRRHHGRAGRGVSKCCALGSDGAKVGPCCTRPRS